MMLYEKETLQAIISDVEDFINDEMNLSDPSVGIFPQGRLNQTFVNNVNECEDEDGFCIVHFTDYEFTLLVDDMVKFEIHVNEEGEWAIKSFSILEVA